jgi:conjugative transfer signal peptidase TraF
MIGRRSVLLIGTTAAVSISLVTGIVKVKPCVVYNASASVPIGFYRMTPANRLRKGDMVLVETPEAVRDLADRRRYLPRTVPMIKVIAALTGDQVCATGSRISINGREIAIRQRVDGLGRAMPQWFGCQALEADEVFLLNEKAPLSFDGRYFGVVKTRQIIGRVTPL